MIAHELAHIRNRDTLTQAVRRRSAAHHHYLVPTCLLGFGGDDESPLGLIGALALVLLAPTRQRSSSSRSRASASTRRTRPEPDQRATREPRIGAPTA